MKEKEKITNLTLVALFAVLTAVGAQIAIPMGSVPITLQMFFVFLAGFVLKPIDALLSMIVYVTLGAIGIPVFANFSAGIQHLVGPTAGYLWAFTLSAFIISLLKKINPFMAGLIGLSVVYLLGWLVLGMHIGNFSKAFFVGVVPFIALDLVKMILSLIVSEKLIKILGGIAHEQSLF
ncbi:MAG: biotin transporter BioY [Fervidobacterium sp.]